MRVMAPPPRRRSRFDAPEVVLEPDDVVLAEVRPVLHLDEDDVGVALVGDAVRALQRDVDGLAGRNLGSPLPSSVTVAVPATMNQCSARLEWRW